MEIIIIGKFFENSLIFTVRVLIFCPRDHVTLNFFIFWFYDENYLKLCPRDHVIIKDFSDKKFSP